MPRGGIYRCEIEDCSGDCGRPIAVSGSRTRGEDSLSRARACAKRLIAGFTLFARWNSRERSRCLDFFRPGDHFPTEPRRRRSAAVAFGVSLPLCSLLISSLHVDLYSSPFLFSPTFFLPSFNAVYDIYSIIAHVHMYIRYI